MAFQTQPAIALIAGIFVLAIAAIILVAVCSDGDSNFVVVTPDGTVSVGSGTPADGTQAPTNATLPPAVTSTPESERVYTVESGDTLIGICADIVPTLPIDECVDAIIALNGLASGDQIAVGQDLVLPGAGPLPTRPPTATPDPDAPTATAEPTATATTPPPPTSYDGSGSEVLTGIAPAGPVTVLNFTHPAPGPLSVTLLSAGQQSLLVNTEGPYTGTRPVGSDAPFTLDIAAESGWTLEIAALPTGGLASVTGLTDGVPASFDPPEDGDFEFLHGGGGNFVVILHCTDGSQTIVNDIGVFDSTIAISFGAGPCYWEVQADGFWSINAS